VRSQARRLGFGLATILGLSPRGFFIPYRHAGTVAPMGYPALRPLFQAAEPRFRAVLDDIAAATRELDAIAAGDGPARFDQDWFPRLDAAAAYAILRAHKPRRIVEIGSGHSTRFLARAVTPSMRPETISSLKAWRNASTARGASSSERVKPIEFSDEA